MKKRISIFAFFSGIGILDLAFEKNGYNIVFVNEYDSDFIKAYKCKHCHRCQILVDNKYVDARQEDIFLDAIDHNYEYTENGDGTHTAECSRCHNKFTENCEYGAYTDNNDGTHSADCFKCGYHLTESHHYEDSVCAECGCEEHAVTYIPGDVNRDGSVNNKDVVSLFKYVSSGETAENESVYDFNGDGVVNNKDVVALFKYVSAV